MSTRPATPASPTALLREVFAATPLGIVLAALRQSRTPSRRGSVIFTMGSVPR